MMGLHRFYLGLLNHLHIDIFFSNKFILLFDILKNICTTCKEIAYAAEPRNEDH